LSKARGRPDRSINFSRKLASLRGAIKEAKVV